MKFIPIKTRELKPPKDDLFAVLDESVLQLEERDIVLITSKVVSIHQGRCVLKTDTTKRELATQEADMYLDTQDKKFITVSHHALSLHAGIDPLYQYYLPLPEKPHIFAQSVVSFLKKRFGLDKVGVIITDSHSMPLRRGVMCYAIGWAGISPLLDRGNREYKKWTSNVVDAVAAFAGLYLGESAQLTQYTPIVIARGVEHIEFTDKDMRADFFIDEDDMYRPVFQHFIPKKSK